MNPAYPFTRARGAHLDACAACLGVTRKRWLWFFREPDFEFRRRITTALGANIVTVPMTVAHRVVRGQALSFNPKTGKVEP